MKVIFFVLLVKGILANLTCTVSVYQNQSVAYIISGPPTSPGCLPEWTAANTMLVDEKGNIYHQVVLHAEPQRILTIDCQHDVAYHLECLALGVSSVVKCKNKCPTAPVATVTKVAYIDSTVELPVTGRNHVVAFAVGGIAVLLGFVIMTVIIFSKFIHWMSVLGKDDDCHLFQVQTSSSFPSTYIGCLYLEKMMMSVLGKDDSHHLFQVQTSNV